MAIGIQGNSCVLMARAFVFAIVYHLGLKRGYILKHLTAPIKTVQMLKLKRILYRVGTLNKGFGVSPPQ